MKSADERSCLFDTAIGACGLAWSERGVTRLQLPEFDRHATEKRLGTRAGARDAIPPGGIAQVIAAIRDYLMGCRIEFSGVAVDLTGISAFHRAVYAAARCVGWGQTASYGELARRAGAPDSARAVGQALGRNPVPIVIPCHRILTSGRRIGGFSAFGGTATKERLLALEGVQVGTDAPLLPGLDLPVRR